MRIRLSLATLVLSRVPSPWVSVHGRALGGVFAAVGAGGAGVVTAVGG